MIADLILLKLFRAKSFPGFSMICLFQHSITNTSHSVQASLILEILLPFSFYSINYINLLLSLAADENILVSGLKTTNSLFATKIWS